MYTYLTNIIILRLKRRKLLSPIFSSISAWTLIILIYFSPVNHQALNSLPLYIIFSALMRDIIALISILILISYSFLSRHKLTKIYWSILNIPLLCIFPFLFLKLLKSILYLYYFWLHIYPSILVNYIN